MTSSIGYFKNCRDIIPDIFYFAHAYCQTIIWMISGMYTDPC